ncbi:MAG TPA: HAD-IIIC family phosphatase [Terriglobales bacterium]|jgi:FkbH-like protein|nr:HAD-IIIC family phosphatase [Terriglobales bacterium]
MMDWLPPPENFRACLGLALEPSPDRLEKLAALAQHRLGLLEIIQLDRALGSACLEPSQGFSSVRLAILTSATVDHLVPSIRVCGLRRRLLIDVYVGPYGQYRQQLLDAESPLHRLRPQIVLLSLTPREVTAAVPLTATATEADAAIGRSIDELRMLWRKARETFHATVIQQTFLNTADPLFGSYDRLVAGAPAQLISQLNERLSQAAAEDGVLVLDIARASERDGLDMWFDVTRWLQAKMEVAPQAAPAYGDLLARVIAAQRGLSKKCLVLDLDNTLWGGVIGDDGPEGIILGEGTGTGEAHLALQRYAKQLRERGVILAICSKNDPAVAEAVFRDHPEMLLRRTDIAAFVANWEDKAANLRRIAEQLNIGIESLVFVDDNPAERARIRQSLPMVAVPELPADAAQYARCLADAGYFESVAFTTEDARRGEQYSANASRESFLESSQSMDDFLRLLEMSMTFGPFRTVDLARVAQLIGKTNQFNPTTRRHSLEDVTRFAATDRCLTLQFRLVDRFGDNGLVSAMILLPDPQSPDLMEIDTWVMSCRVFGRQLEQEAMNIAVETARRMGIRMFRADYIPTSKNGVVRELYSALGFTLAQDAATPHDGATRWFLRLSDYVPQATHISRRSEQHDRSRYSEPVDADSPRPSVRRFDRADNGD